MRIAIGWRSIGACGSCSGKFFGGLRTASGVSTGVGGKLLRGLCIVSSGRRGRNFGSGFLLLFLLLLHARDLHLEHCAVRGIRRHGLLAVHDLLNHLLVGKFVHDFARTHAQSAEGCQTRFDGAIGNLFWMELQIDPLVDAHGDDLLDIARPRSKGQAIQSMHRALLFARRQDRQAFLLVRDQLRDRADQGQRSRLRHSRTSAGLPKLDFMQTPEGSESPSL